MKIACLLFGALVSIVPDAAQGLFNKCIDDAVRQAGIMEDVTNDAVAAWCPKLKRIVADASLTAECSTEDMDSLTKLTDSGCMDTPPYGMGAIPACVDSAAVESTCNPLFDEGNFMGYCDCWKDLDLSGCDGDDQASLTAKLAYGCWSDVNFAAPHGDFCLSGHQPGAPQPYRCWNELVKAPSSAPSSSVPLVIDLHGQDDTAQMERDLSAFDVLDAPMVIAWPSGLNKEWNVGGFGKPLVDDVAFLSQLISLLLAKHPVADPSRVYLTGLSNGCWMAQRLAIERPEMVTAVACGAGYLAGSTADGSMYPPQDVVERYATAARIPAIMEVHGTRDEISRYQFSNATGTSASSRGGRRSTGAARTRLSRLAAEHSRMCKRLVARPAHPTRRSIW